MSPFNVKIDLFAHLMLFTSRIMFCAIILDLIRDAKYDIAERFLTSMFVTEIIFSVLATIILMCYRADIHIDYRSHVVQSVLVVIIINTFLSGAVLGLMHSVPQSARDWGRVRTAYADQMAVSSTFHMMYIMTNCALAYCSRR